MSLSTTRPAVPALVGAAAAFGLVQAVYAMGAIGQLGLAATLATGSSFALTVGIGLYLLLQGL
jgi:hypothetical protein